MPEGGIFDNLAFSIPVGIILFILFVHFRATNPLFYHRNILCNGNPVYGAKIFGKFGDWFADLRKLPDATMLRLAGLDALVSSNTFRLFLMFGCIIALPCLLILVPYYYFHSDHIDKITFHTFTISELYVFSFWPPLLVLVFLTVIVIYGVYTFYTHFVRLRQAYIFRPSSLNSIGEVLEIAEAFGSIKYARRRFDSSTCTVLMRPIPSDISDHPDKLKDILENSGMKGIKSVQFIGDFNKLNDAAEDRNSTLIKLEEALKTVTEKLLEKKKAETATATGTETEPLENEDPSEFPPETYNRHFFPFRNSTTPQDFESKQI